MSFITKKHLPRRTFLRGMMGATIALPLLDSMIPSMTALAATAANPKRSEERRVGKECTCQCRSRWSPYH
jgi:hypothetical protein